MNRLRHFESWIEQVVEEPFVRLFAGRLLPEDVARRLVRAIEEGENAEPGGQETIPNTYRVDLNPEDLQALKANQPHLSQQLTDSLGELVSRMDAQMKGPPEVILSADEDVPVHQVRITPVTDEDPGNHATEARQTGVEPTQDIEVSRLRQMLDEEVGRRPQAYLIIEGDRLFDLEDPIVTLGRAFDNDVILEDPRVSRHHAQLRQRYGRYILKDLGSSGGTTVNGFPVQEIVLRPGDVISLSGTDAIYAESEPTQPEQSGDTQPLPTDEA